MIRQNKECVAMLLAGGQGSRLEVLTRKVAKPAVHFGGKYRIIDFTLSNCINSGIDTVGILTQYRPLELIKYVGSGRPWSLDRNHGGVHILPPYARANSSEWYKGTANAICQNIEFIDEFSPKYVLVLSGDHIYKMDYSRMIAAHEKNNADVTISVINVPRDEASRFGIVISDETGRITEFEEKPKNPKSTCASMGVYLFSWDTLRKALLADNANSASSNDFGHDVLPMLLNEGARMFTYEFEGYWKDVGTLDSLWDANMDLINPRVPMRLDDPDFRIFMKTSALPPQYISSDAVIADSFVSEGCEVYGNVDFTVLSTGCYIGKNAVVRDSVIMPDAVIEEGAVVQYAIVGEGVRVGKNAVVGSRPEDSPNRDDWGITVIGYDLKIGENAVVPCKKVIAEDVPGRSE
ncbi:MAG: glucose-1-phosphate adenylyltransferase [Clostridia bacterium]|nr:glucose-1-phosphate adenylyltransferase [Clostridia bacterium]